jgi:hypothetical protein
MEKDLKKQHEEERKLLDKKIDNQNIRKQLLVQLQSEFDAIGESVT